MLLGKDMKKYAHFLIHNSVGWNKIFIEMIVSDNRFQLDNHLFITVNEELYSIFKNKCDIIYESINDYSKLVNKYGDEACWLILHSLPAGWGRDFRIDKKFYDKIIWRTWGHDSSPARYYSGLLSILRHPKWILKGDWKLVLKDIKNMRGFKKLRQFKAIGLGSSIDRFAILKYFRNKKKANTYVLCYGQPGEYEVLHENKSNNSQDGLYHVMVGHSGYGDDHIKIIDMLKPYEKEKIKLHFILSYGEKDYIESVVRYIKDNWHGQYEVLSESLSYNDYSNYLSYMDAAILDGMESYALGNVAILMFYGKKVFLNTKGLLSYAFTKFNIYHESTDKIGKLSFDEFIQPVKGCTQNERYHLLTYDGILELWKQMFDDLDAE